MRTELTIVVKKEYTDGLGHLNHVAAVRLLEQARGEWYRQCGLHDDGSIRYGAVVVNINFNYRRECFMDETLRIVTREERLGTKSIVLWHEIIKEDNTVAVSGRATSVVMDMNQRITVPVPACIVAATSSNCAVDVESAGFSIEEGMLHE